ncbi:MAG: hypothetical protein IH822_06795 [Chloroflexi bacterium]|nr:hypothetical protein [Chloroflexota bacterium]
MNGQNKYIVFGALTVVAMIIGSLLFALAIDSGNGDDTFGSVFVGSLGFALLVSGIGGAIAVVATYLAKRD